VTVRPGFVIGLEDMGPTMSTETALMVPNDRGRDRLSDASIDAQDDTCTAHGNFRTARAYSGIVQGWNFAVAFYEASRTWTRTCPFPRPSQTSLRLGAVQAGS
jgi:hypothetical protein